jgi:hypothetical protein
VLYIDRVEDEYLKPVEGKLREIKKKYKWHSQILSNEEKMLSADTNRPSRCR